MLAAWLSAKTARTRHHDRTPMQGLRFAFYWRVSTEGFQDPASSRRWQFDVASELITGRGRIVAEYFDIGYTRELSPADRPQAATLLAAITDPDRGFDAIVIGEFARAFSGSQLIQLAQVLHEHRMQLWIPEFDGPVDLHDPVHQAAVMLLGVHAKREVQRARFRTTRAMMAQAREQGRYLGGRPPYGYRLVDAGPHPNRIHAEWGRRLHRLDPDPLTAPYVAWIFSERLAGHSVAGIARSLNEMAIPRPSAIDRERNPHRPGEAWRQRTVAAILANPRYTGRQVWNRHHTACERTDGAITGLLPVRRPSDSSEWVISDKPAHPALVSEADFIAAQAITSMSEPRTCARRYLLVGLLRCWLCRRSLEPLWSHGNPSYRCRHGHTTAHRSETRTAANLYLREDVIIAQASIQTHGVSSRDPRIQQQLAQIRGGTNQPADLAGFLHAYKITIICGAYGITLETDAADLTIAPQPTNPPNAGIKIPRQRWSALAALS